MEVVPIGPGVAIRLPHVWTEARQPRLFANGQPFRSFAVRPNALPPV